MKATDYDDYIKTPEAVNAISNYEFSEDVDALTPEQIPLLADALSEHLNTLSDYEDWAEDNGLLSSEDELTELYIDAFYDGEQHQAQAAMDNDQPMESENFNNWSDSLCEDGEIHSLQYSEYCYGINAR